MNQKRLCISLLASGLLTTFTASAQSYVQAAPGFIAYVADASAANPNGTVVHSFQLKNQVGGYPRLFQISDYGRIGVGNLNSWDLKSLLNIGKGMASFTVDALNGGACLGFNAARQADGEFFLGSNGTDNGGSLIWADPQGNLNFSTRRSGPASNGTGGVMYDRWLSPSWATEDRRLKISSTGQVQIGGFSPASGLHTDYKLAVDGKLVARSVHVTQLNWADFVFEPGHSLRSLPALKQYVQTHHHLPAIPSAQEVARDGISLGDMDARLLQTLEELTLHVIALNERNEQLQVRVAQLAAQLQQATLVSTPAGR